MTMSRPVARCCQCTRRLRISMGREAMMDRQEDRSAGVTLVESDVHSCVRWCEPYTLATALLNLGACRNMVNNRAMQMCRSAEPSQFCCLSLHRQDHQQTVPGVPPLPVPLSTCVPAAVLFNDRTQAEIDRNHTDFFTASATTSPLRAVYGFWVRQCIGGSALVTVERLRPRL